jgi:hypothetical protein
MPRPKRFTETVRRERTRDRLRRLHPEYAPPDEAPAIFNSDAEAERNRQAHAAYGARIKEARRLGAIARKLIPIVEADQAKQNEYAGILASLFVTVRWDYKAGRDHIPDPSLPVLGGAQPTHGEMRVTLEEGLRHAMALRDWYRHLSAALLLRVRVPMRSETTADDPSIGVVIEKLAETLTREAERYKPKPGHQLGERHAAQGAAGYLIRFVNLHFPNLTVKRRRIFVFRCLRDLGIPRPNLDLDPGDFNAWYAEAESRAGRAAAPEDLSPDHDPDHVLNLEIRAHLVRL